MQKKLQILLFYILLILLFIGVAWKVSADDSKMVNCLSAASVAVGLSSLMWQNYGRYKAY